MATRRADKKRNLAKVAKVVLAEPLLTEREIAKKAGVSKTTVRNMKDELAQIGPKDDRIVGLTDGDFEIQTIIQSEKRKRLKNASNINNKDLDARDNSAMKRYTLFRGSATDEDGGLNINIVDYTQL